MWKTLLLGLLLGCSTPAAVRDLIDRLDAESIDERQGAQDALVALGARALPALRDVLREPRSLEQGDRARSAIAEIEFEERIRAVSPEAFRVWVGPPAFERGDWIAHQFSLVADVARHIRIVGACSFDIREAFDQSGRAVRTQRLMLDGILQDHNFFVCDPPTGTIAHLRGTLTCTFPFSEREVVFENPSIGDTQFVAGFEIRITEGAGGDWMLDFGREGALERIVGGSAMATDAEGRSISAEPQKSTPVLTSTGLERFTIEDPADRLIYLRFRHCEWRKIKSLKFRFVDSVTTREFPFEIRDVRLPRP